MAKIVCAWCGRVLKEDSDENVSRVICPACYDEEVRPIVEAQNRAKAGKAFKPPPLDEFRRPFSFIEDQLLLGFAIFMLWFLVVMTFEGLHWLTGGKVPELIEWQPAPHYHSDRGGQEKRGPP